MGAICDTNGIEIKAGDRLVSAYGIPGTEIVGSVVERDGRLIVLTPGHKPTECTLKSFVWHLGNVWITTD